MSQRAIWTVSFLLLVLVACQPSGGNDVPTEPGIQTATINSTTPSGESPEQEPTATQTFLPVVRSPATATAPPPTAVPPTPVDQISLVPIGSISTGDLEQPLYLTHAFDDRLFVVEKDGTIRIIQDGQLLVEPFLNIDGRVGSDGYEQGLLSVAFHPNYMTAGQPGFGHFFANYTNNDGNTVVSRYQVSEGDPNWADPDRELILLTVEQPYRNHNGGLLKFGPDGYLYIGLGDGGGDGDPHGHSQNLATLLGSILRIDVSQTADSYDIPADNPFVGNTAARPEIWAYGLRNPWRFSFDRLTGDLYIADVGQGSWEEVNFQPVASQGGENYGWNIMEASHCYDVANCSANGMVWPIFEYDHGQHCSITGGYVYRGQQFPELTGNYFVGDYCSGIIWRLFPDTNGRWLPAEVLTSDVTSSSFGEDANGELYVVDYKGRGIYQIQPANQ